MASTGLWGTLLNSNLDHMQTCTRFINHEKFIVNFIELKPITFIPGVFLHRDNRVIIGMNVDIGKGTTYYTSPKLEENKWYTYEIMQKEVYFCSVKSLACS